MTAPACTVDGCAVEYAAKGYCHLHYNRWKRHGDPHHAQRMMPRDASIAERLALLTTSGETPDDCQEFNGGLHHTGYARVRIGGVEKGLHVWALIEASGEDHSATMDALHSCDNRACANARHLRWGTLQDNMDDKVARGRQSRLGGEAHPGAKLTWPAVREIRSRAGEPLPVLASAFGVSKSLVSLILRNERWIEAAA
ncbi:hypothetical protein FB562_2225 [Homoserinimonas aerilata]|uniref:HNH endonuclease n=1 Tax=Homoserinimonas aerilata TaxID=1162970 RepID=A0A542YF52_9MICO|nr:hypothetical protein [Homoserinimonas aerilata]TQL46701.1 hypothetical protein FB562_2225 [Homoserinimonas aerilata]